MIRDILKQISQLFLVLIGISIVAFVLGIISPGDPAELVLSRGGNYSPTPEQIEIVREDLGLNRPYIIQYFSWLKNVIKGDFGTSFSTSKPVSTMILECLPITLKLSFLAFFSSLILGLSLGVISSYKKESFIDYIISSFSNFTLSFPGFWVGLILILIFSENLKILPTSGLGTFKNWIMPTIVTALPTIAMVQRYMRASMLSEYSKLYYKSGIARGVKKSKMTFIELLPNAIISIIPMLGNYLGGILGGSAIVEKIFALPGMGSLALSAIKMKDFPLIQSYVLISGTIFVIITMGVDIIIRVIYPKIGRIS